jgi:hypothetical protein
MNDEDFARQAFAAAFRSGSTGEPPALPDVEGLASRGRRAARYRHGTYAAGTTALAGVVTAGIVTGPALLGLGTNAGSHSVSAGGGGATTSAGSASVAASAKPFAGVPCTSSPTINWLGVVSAALPAGVTATPDDRAASCTQMSDGSRSYEARFKLSTGEVGLQVNVGTGHDVAVKLGAGAIKLGLEPSDAAESLDPSTLASLQAKKLAAAACENSAAAAMATRSEVPLASLDAAAIASLEAQKKGLAGAVVTCENSVRDDPGLAKAGSASARALDPSLDAAGIASAEAKKHAIASAEATASPVPGADEGDGKPIGDGGCSRGDANETTCVSHIAKGSISVVEVQLLRGGSSPILVDIQASNGKGLSTPAPGQLPSDATMTAIAEAVASHF